MTVGVLASLTGDTYGVAGGGGSAGSGYTFADATYVIPWTLTNHWDFHIGIAGDNAIIGVQAGTHSGSKVRNVTPLAGQKFIGQTDGVPTVQFPNGTPTSIIDGQENGALTTGSNFVSSSTVDDVTIENLEIKNFAPAHGGADTLGGDVGADNWLVYNNHIHHVQRAVKLGAGWRVAHNLIEYCYNGSIFGYQANGIIIEDNTFQHINTEHDDWNLGGSEASSKFAGGGQPDNWLIRFNHFEDHFGPAVWFDGSPANSTARQFADIHHNFFKDNLIAFMWEVMGVGSEVVGVDFHHNYIENVGVLWNTYERLRGMFIAESRGSAAYPIKVNDNTVVWTSQNREFAGQPFDLQQSDRGWVDWVEVLRNTATNEGSLGGAGAETGAIFGLYEFLDAHITWGSDLKDRNLDIDYNTYTWKESTLGTQPFVRVNTNATESWATWQAAGFDTNGRYTAT